MSIVINLFFGIALFLFGMNLMSEHLKKLGGARSEKLLFKLTSSPFKGALTGAGVTSFIQSSSAVSAMTLSLIDSHILLLKQAISIIIGSIFGTAITGWIVAFSTVSENDSIFKIFSAHTIAAFLALSGIIMKQFIKNRTAKRIGEIFLGFSLLLLGIQTISQVAAPLSENTEFLKIISSYQNPLISFFIGILLSGLLQSASAAVGIIQSVSFGISFHLQTLLPMLIGIGIGASMPVILVAIGKRDDTKRCALSYFLINLLGCVIGLILYVPFNYFFKDYTFNPVMIAFINTSYRFVLMIVSIPLTKQIEKLTKTFIREKEPYKTRTVKQKEN